MRAWWVIAGIALAAPACAGEAREGAAVDAPRAGESAPIVIDAGALRMTVYFARTAEVFHVIDQLSSWSPYTHPGYASLAARFDARDKELLAVHAAMRAARGWGNGFEQAFYTDAPIEAAAERARASGVLTADEARIEAVVLAHFAPLLAPYLDGARARVRAFAARIAADSSTLREGAGKIAHFMGVGRLDVPAFFIPNPDDTSYGGGMNGGRLVAEIPPTIDVGDVILHEAMHGFVQAREADVKRAAASGRELSYETLNEGLAYAIAPGIVHTRAGADPLTGEVERDRKRGKTLADTHARFHAYALALRPLLEAALQQGTSIDAFFPDALATWNKLNGR